MLPGGFFLLNCIHEFRLHCGGRREWWRSQSNQHADGLRLSELHLAVFARAQVSLELLPVFAVERTECVEVEIFRIGVRVHQFSSCFRDCIPVRTLVFTVPNGLPVRVAISL